MLVDFALHSVEAIEPSRGGIGPDGERRLPTVGWFHLTDGHYWLNVGEVQLFHATEAYVAALNQESPAADPSPFVNYYVVRLWEDLLGLVPTVLEPVPPALAHRLSSDAAWRRWARDVRRWQRSWHGDEEDLLLERATRWWHERSLSTAHLRYGPRIWLWRDEGTIRIRWDNRGLVHEDSPVWTAIVGRDALAVDRFVEELRSFHVRLIQAMADRVEAARAVWVRPDIAIDLAGLAQEHAWRERWGAEALASAAGEATDWDVVLAAVAVLEARYSTPAR